MVSIGSAKTDSLAKDYYETIEWNKKHPHDKKPVSLVSPEDIKDTVEDYKLPFGNEKELAKSEKRVVYQFEYMSTNSTTC